MHVHACVHRRSECLALVPGCLTSHQGVKNICSFVVSQIERRVSYRQLSGLRSISFQNESRVLFGVKHDQSAHGSEGIESAHVQKLTTGRRFRTRFENIFNLVAHSWVLASADRTVIVSDALQEPPHSSGLDHVAASISVQNTDTSPPEGSSVQPVSLLFCTGFLRNTY